MLLQCFNDKSKQNERSVVVVCIQPKATYIRMVCTHGYIITFIAEGVGGVLLVQI